MTDDTEYLPNYLQEPLPRKPCPFCGGEPEVYQSTKTLVYVRCSKCYSTGPFGISEQKAWEKWEHRE
jgi:Lar family restriction alleviation protein